MNSNEVTYDELAAAWQEIVTRVAARRLPEALIAFSRRANGTDGDEHLVFAVTYGQATACFLIRLRQQTNLGTDDAYDRLIDRFDELRAQHEKLGARMSSVHARAQEAVQRAGGDMRLISLGMEPAWIGEKLDWYGTRLEAEIEILDNKLKPETVRMLAFTGRRFAGNIRLYGVTQRRRHRQLARLRQRGAVLEIDSLDEALIIAHGHDVAEIGRRLLNGERSVELVTSDGAEGAIDLTARISEGRRRFRLERRGQLDGPRQHAQPRRAVGPALVLLRSLGDRQRRPAGR
jgi:hypothetical protein